MTTALFSRKGFLALAICLLGLAIQARGQVLINWSSEINSKFFDSAGTALSGTYNFKLGVFDTSGGAWSPTLATAAEWEGRWTEMDSGTFNGTDYFAGSYILNDNLTFAQGQQAYMWIYDSLAAPGTNEWLLFTDDSSDGNAADDWVIPLAQAYDPNCNCGTLPQDWVAINGSGNVNPVVGGLSNLQGPGDYTATPPDFQYQTATIILPVPEPGSLLLPLLGLGYFSLRRKRA